MQPLTEDEFDDMFGKDQGREESITLETILRDHKSTRSLGTPPYELDLSNPLHVITDDDLVEAYVACTDVEMEWQALGNECDGCHAVTQTEDLFLYYDHAGVGFFEKECMTKLLQGMPTPNLKNPNTMPKDFVEKGNPLLGMNLSSIEDKLGEELENRLVDGSWGDIIKPTISPKPVQTSFGSSGYLQSQSSYTRCHLKSNEGHLGAIPFTGTEGGVIVASSRVGKLHEKATAALFFDTSWKSSLSRKPFKVELTNNKSGLIPDFSHEAEITADIPMAFIPWTDMAAPVQTIEKYVLWALDYIKKGGWLQIGCIGGHGRTGTFLALMLLADGRAEDADDAVCQTRALYCNKAIESTSQADYIYAAAGEPSPTTSHVDSIKPFKSEEEPQPKPIKNKKANSKPPTYPVAKVPLTGSKK